MNDLDVLFDSDEHRLEVDAFWAKKIYTAPSSGYDKKPWHHDYDRNQDPAFNQTKFGDPRDRPFTQIAAKMLGGHNALNADMCVTCQSDITGFRNEISQKEFSISGMCQGCQDSVFGKD